MHSIMDPPVGTFAGSIVEPTDVPTEDILPPTEDILPPLLPASEDILPASDNIPVRFTVGIVISANVTHHGRGDVCAPPARFRFAMAVTMARATSAFEANQISLGMWCNSRARATRILV